MNDRANIAPVILAIAEDPSRRIRYHRGGPGGGLVTFAFAFGVGVVSCGVLDFGDEGFRCRRAFRALRLAT